MASLHTKYRPSSFSKVVGNAAVVKSLESVLASDSSHAFLFHGPSGCGKTTLARICAAELGCTPEYLMEFDAATHTGVDNIRDVQEMLRYLPMGGSRVRVVILDEAHMLSKSAWNSLLKVIEEPPSHIYWFFCTTELGKVPQTIKTRCMAFGLSSVSEADLKKLLRRVLKGEKHTLADDAILDVIVSEAKGSPRQAIVNLSSCMHVETASEASEILKSAVVSEPVVELCRFLLNGGGSWSSAMKIATKLKDTESESVRIVLCNYMAATLRNKTARKDAERILAILDAFDTPYNASEKQAPLLLSIGRVLFQ